MGSSSLAGIEIQHIMISLPSKIMPEKEMGEEKTPKIMKFWIVLSILVSMCLMSTMVILHLMHIQLSDEVANLKTEVQILKLKSRDPLSTMKWTPFKRQKRQVRADLRAAEKSGVKVLDYGYGADLNTESELSIYPTLMGELLDEQNAFGGNNGHQNQNAFDDHNQLGILREGSNQASATEKPLQSAYARRVNSHRHSRVASTPEVTTKTYIAPNPTTSPKPRPVPKSLLKSLDGHGSRMLDSKDNPILSIHLQAKLQASHHESSTDLDTGIHNSWRLSPWSKRLHGAGVFVINEEEGQIEIPESGLYLVYAQIEYMDVSETNGFEVDLDSEAILSCVVTTSGSDDSKKHNTCYTSAALFLQRGALLNIRDKEAGRYSLLHSKGTFFGITSICVGITQAKH